MGADIIDMTARRMTDKKQVKEMERAKTTETVQTAVDLGIYTPLSVAKEEIWRRWNDKDMGMDFCRV